MLGMLGKNTDWTTSTKEGSSASVDVYENITLSVLDDMCPVKTKERVLKPKVPWYNDNILAQRRVRQRLECKWGKTCAEIDYEQFLTQKNSVTQMINDAKLDYFSDKFSTCNVKDMQLSTAFSIQHPEFFLSVNLFLIMSWPITSSHFS